MYGHLRLVVHPCSSDGGPDLEDENPASHPGKMQSRARLGFNYRRSHLPSLLPQLHQHAHNVLLRGKFGSL